MTVGTALLSHLPTPPPHPPETGCQWPKGQGGTLPWVTPPRTLPPQPVLGKSRWVSDPRGRGCVENVPAGEGWPVPGGVSHPSQAALSKTPINGGNPPPAFAGTSEETGVIST